MKDLPSFKQFLQIAAVVIILAAASLLYDTFVLFH
jgi:hypothetical protein